MKSNRSYMNFIVSALLTLAIILMAGLLGDYYFDLNDDVLMKDILSGAYTGTPAGHNIQMLYPISAFISLLYRGIRSLDWYGIFLCFCQYFCVFILIGRGLSLNEDRLYKAHVAACLFFFMLGGAFAHFLFVQYTFTCGMMSATALFVIMTHKGPGKRDFVLSWLLIIVAFLIRSEMLLLTLPVVGVGILIKWVFSRHEIKSYYDGGVEVSRYGEKKDLFKTYVFLCLAIVLGLVVCEAAHGIAYSSADWKKFNDFFNARTELYDFQYIPDYAQNKDFYDGLGLSESQQRLLVNYNFGIDESIDAKVLWDVAKYAADRKSDTTPFLTKLARGTSQYLYRLRHIAFQKSYEYPMTDAPFNVIVVLLYLGTIVIFCMDKDREKRIMALLSLLLLFACRSTLWLYIIVRGRDPIRITHPLYLMEIAVLTGMLLNRARGNRWNIFIPLVTITVTTIMFIPNQISVVSNEMAERAKMRAHYDALYEFFDENPDNFYFVDVYTSVSALDGEERTFSEKMFVNVDNAMANHDLMGGWASKSPLYYQKLKENGFTSMQDALLEERVYVVSKLSSDITWISDYYRDKGVEVNVEKTRDVTDAFGIYKVSAR